MTKGADIYSRSHQAVGNILKDITQISSFVTDSVKELSLQLELLAATEEFTKDARTDVIEAISRVKELPACLRPVIEQLTVDLEVISRGIAESAGLTKQARGRLETAGEFLQDTEAAALASVNLAANIKTLAEGREYLATRRDVLKRVLQLAGAKVVRDILEEMEREK